MVEKLSEDQVATAVAEHPNWSEMNGAIQRTYQFNDFIESMAFVNKVADHAESVQHHPDILVRYNKVTLTLSTHDAGGITEKDFDFATEADKLA